MEAIKKAAGNLFERCAIRSSGESWYQIKCKLGLWAVTAPDRATAEHEAIRYWLQYFNDGEYDWHLGMHEEE